MARESAGEPFEKESRDGSVGTATKLQRGGRRIAVSRTGKSFHLLQSVRTGSGTHPVVSFSVNKEIKALGA
jgi:hypothetical protein